MAITKDTEERAHTPESLAARVSRQRWSVAAGACVFIAAACLLLGRMDAAFVVATLGVVAWFWNERNRLRPHGIEDVERFEQEDEEIEDEVDK